jgi:hypothetical protein
MSLDKHPRIESRKYLDWVATLPCADCSAEDGTVVAHHLKGRLSPLSGGAGFKANDYNVMPLCYKHHNDIHNGDATLLNCYTLRRLVRLLRIRSIGWRFNLRYALQTKVLRRPFRMKKDYVGN